MSYLVSDIGKSGVPQLSVRERATIETIRRHLRSKTLRFAWIEHHTATSEFIVFDASDGPCTIGSLGYPVISGTCNEYYKPGENPYETFAAPGDSIARCYRPSPSSRAVKP